MNLKNTTSYFFNQPFLFFKGFAVIMLLSGISFMAISQNPVSVDNIKTNLEFLSNSNLKGRLPGTQGYDIASDYCKEKFALYNLKSFNLTDKYTQIVPLEKNIIIGPCDFSVVHYSKGRMKHKLGTNYNFRGFTGSGEKTLETVFCGFGISQSDYDDYANVDVNGKAVLIFKGEANLDSIKTDPFTIRSRTQTAVEHGAEAVIFIPMPGVERNKPIGSTMCGEGEQHADIPQIQIDNETLNLLLDGSEIDIANLYAKIKSTQKPESHILKSRIYVNVQASYVPEIKSYNTIGYIEGSDSVLKNEYILVTAHIDHVGSQCELIYPGANDNASGCTAVLEIARLMSQENPERSIIFALLTAEESGLHGSKFLAANLPVDSSQIVAAFNFDCIASGDSIQIGNGLSNPELYKIAKINDTEKLMVKDTWSGGGADLTAFSAIGIPGLYFVSKYSYTNLHLQSDTYENANIPILVSITKLGYQVVKTVSKGDYKREEIVK